MYEESCPILEELVKREKDTINDGRVILPAYDYYRNHYLLFESDVGYWRLEGNSPWKDSHSFRAKFLLDPKGFLYLARFQLYTLMNGEPDGKDFFLDSIIRRWDYPFANSRRKIGSKTVKMYNEILFSLIGRDLEYVDKTYRDLNRVNLGALIECGSLALMNSLFCEQCLQLNRAIQNFEKYNPWGIFRSLVDLREILLNSVLKEYLEKEDCFVYEKPVAFKVTFSLFMKNAMKEIAQIVEKDDSGRYFPLFNARGIKERTNVFDVEGRLEGVIKTVLALYSYDSYSFDDLKLFKKFLLVPDVFTKLDYGSNKKERKIFYIGLTKIIKGFELENEETRSSITFYKEMLVLDGLDWGEHIKTLEKKGLQERKRIDGFKELRDRVNPQRKAE